MATEINLMLGADTTQMDKGTTSLNEITGAAKKTASELASLARTEEALYESGHRLVLKLEDLVATFGLTTTQLYSFRAAQTGVTDQAAPLIAQLEAMKAATAQYGVVITDVSQIEAARIAWDQTALTVFNAFKIRTLEENAAAEAEAIAKQESAAVAFNAFKIRTMAENRAAAIADINEMVALQDAAIAKQESALTAFQAFKIRTMDDNRKEAIAILDAQEAAAAALAEKQAIAEIAWSDMSLKAKIANLEKLQAYQASPAISSATVSSTFSSAAINDLPNLTKYQNEYNAALAATASAHAAVKTSAAGASAAIGETGVQTARATSEVVVMAREFSRGNFSRMAGSFTILAQALGLSVNPLILLTAGVAAVTYEMVKGALEQEKMNAALVMTGNYADLTSSSMNTLAHSATSAGGSISVAKEAVTALAGSGKFTADEIDKITQSAVLLDRATGQSVGNTIAQFESLAVQMQGGSTRSTEAISKAALKLDDTYHYLTLTIFEQIRALEQDGQAKAASQLAMETYAQVTQDRAKNIIAEAGYIATAWYAVRDAIGSAIDKMMSIGKSDPSADIRKLTVDIAATEAKISNGDVSQTTTLRLTNDLNQLEVAQHKLLTTQTAADEQSKQSIENSAAIHAAETISSQDAKHRKDNLDEYTKALTAYGNQLAALAKVNPDDPLLSQDAIQQHLAGLKKDYTNKPKSTDPYQKATLQDTIAPTQIDIGAQAKQLADSQKLLDAQYAQGDISLKNYLDSEQTARKDAYDATVADYDKEIAAIKVYIATVTDATRKKTAETLLTTEQAKKDTYVNDFTAKDTIASEKDQKTTQAYADSIAKLNIQLLTLQGNLSAAGAAQAALTDRQALKTADANIASGVPEGMPDPQATKDALLQIMAYTQAQKDISQATYDYNLLIEKQTTLEGGLALQQQNGTMTEMDGLAAVRDSRKLEIANLQAIADKYTAIANSVGDPKLKADAAAFQLKVEQTASSADVLAAKMNTLVQGPLETFFSSTMSGTTSVSNAFANMANSILLSLDQVIAKEIVAAALGTGTGGSGGLGAIFSSYIVSGSSGGEMIYADGGYVSGAGTSTSDSISAKLSNGEFVINADSTAKNRALLEAINNGGSIAPAKYADGGYVGPSQAGGNNSSSSQNISIQIVNEGSQGSQIKSATPIFDINGMVVKVVLTDIQKGGPIRSAIQNIAKP